MSDLTLDEADHCPYCDKVLLDPPNCCERMIDEHIQFLNEQLAKLTEYDNEEDIYSND